jgi:pyruvate/2-oxoglutarate dehydrogenase complex dihydrolipoamide acyltransferase (E2) component
MDSAMNTATSSNPHCGIYFVSTPLTLLVLLTLLALAAPAWAMGPAAPFTPPRAAVAAPAHAPTPAPAPAPAPALALAAPAAPAAPAVAALDDNTLQGVRTGAQPMALIEGRWWALGSGPGGRRITAIDSRGIWITLGTPPEHNKAPQRQQRLQLLPHTAMTHPPVLTASAHGARP